MNDLQQAAERLRKWKLDVFHCNMATVHADTMTLANAYIAEHLVDDEEAISFPWIESIGGVIADSGQVYLDTYDMSFWIVKGGLNLTGTTHVIKTRGQLRQLCRALGVEIEEVKE